MDLHPPRILIQIGAKFGAPGTLASLRRHEIVLARALAELPHFTRPGAIRDLGSRWSPDGSRAWEDELRAEMLHDR